MLQIYYLLIFNPRIERFLTHRLKCGDSYRLRLDYLSEILFERLSAADPHTIDGPICRFIILNII